MFGSARRKRQSALVGNTRTVLKYAACYVVFIIAGCMLALSANAASFVIIDGQVITNKQTLDDNETGEIQSGGQLNTGASNGINAPGDDVSINNSGEISTTGILAEGIFSGGDNTSINNSGEISTTGILADCIFSGGDNTSINNSGEISTTGDDAYGILSYGVNASINNSGTISTTGGGAYCIYTRGDNATINNSWTLLTTGDEANGIYSTGYDASINNSGMLLTTGKGADGIYSFSFGSNTSINNSGEISTTGDDAYGILSYGVNASINNSGAISTAGRTALGIFSNGDNTSIDNSGAISTTGDYAEGIHSFGDNTSIDNSGAISTAGRTALGIFSIGDNTSTNNSGAISTTGDYAEGIFSPGDNTSIDNSGAISTTGLSAFGIFSYGDNTSINNSGVIHVTGTDSIGIYSFGADGVITISGDVFATGNATQAIVGDENQTLNLLPGSRIIGSIDLGPGTNTVNITTNSNTVSSTLTIGNPGTINLLGNATIVRNGNVVAVIDPTTQTANRAALSLTMDSIHQAVNQQLMNTPLSKPVHVATTHLLPGMLHQDLRPYVWGHLFGGYRERDDDGNALEYEHDMYGFVCGYENTISRHRVGVFAGVVQSDIETDTDSIEIDTDSFFIGAYGQHVMGNWVLNGSVTAGYSDHDNDRTVLDNLSGFETARSDYDSVSISPSLTLIRTYECKSGIELRPSAQVAYTYAYFDDYSETGTTRSNLRVDSRDVNIVSGRLQLAGSHILSSGRGKVELRGGMKMRHYSSNSVHVNFNGSQLSYTTVGDNNVLGGYFGANVRYQIKGRLDLVGNAEYGQASGEEKSISGYLGLTFSF